MERYLHPVARAMRGTGFGPTATATPVATLVGGAQISGAESAPADASFGTR
jgi:hypothetical protein